MKLLIYLFGFVSGGLATILLLIFVVGQEPNNLFSAPAKIVATVVEPKEFQNAKEKVSSSLFDPYSAHFDGLKAKKSAAGNWICGYVNAKNRMGGYVGRSPFIYDIDSDTAFVISGKKDAFIFSTLVRGCFPDYPIPATSTEANKID